MTHMWVAPIVPFGKSLASDVTEQAVVPSRLVTLGHNLEFEDRIAQDVHGIDKTQPIGRHLGPDRGVMHHSAHRIVREAANSVFREQRASAWPHLPETEFRP